MKKPSGKKLKSEENFLLSRPAPSADLAPLVLLGEEHSGRDEMNLAGHPFALLQSPGRFAQSEPIFYDWPRTLLSGKKVTASWRVEAGAETGMPGPNEELLYLVMLQMTREAAGADGQWPQVVPFRRGDLIARLGWNNGTRGIAAVDEAFRRLNAVSVTAKWAFYDARTQAPMQEVGFHILAGYAITPEPDGRKKSGASPLSWWKWDDVVYTSLLSGNVRSLALDFTLSLSNPTARRLFRLLDLLRFAQKTPAKGLSIGAFKLRDRLGMTAYQHPSKIKEKLLPGIEELQSVGFLGEVEWHKAQDGALLASFCFGQTDPSQVATSPASPPEADQNAPEHEQETSAEPAIESKQEFARRMSERFTALPEVERERLRQVARADVTPVFWDRLESPDSPMSLGLWELVERETA